MCEELSTAAARTLNPQFTGWAMFPVARYNDQLGRADVYIGRENQCQAGSDDTEWMHDDQSFMSHTSHLSLVYLYLYIYIYIYKQLQLLMVCGTTAYRWRNCSAAAAVGEERDLEQSAHYLLICLSVRSVICNNSLLESGRRPHCNKLRQLTWVAAEDRIIWWPSLLRLHSWLHIQSINQSINVWIETDK